MKLISSFGNFLSQNCNTSVTILVLKNYSKIDLLVTFRDFQSLNVIFVQWLEIGSLACSVMLSIKFVFPKHFIFHVSVCHDGCKDYVINPNDL